MPYEPYIDPDERDLTHFHEVPPKINTEFASEKTAKDEFEPFIDKRNSAKEELYNELYNFAAHPQPNLFTNEPPME